ncbi:MAG TPA: trypsin-like peptidase domain-containing protein [Pyrinomonadaceae bacterium]|nr:trypsin-like peptidase domain-containing protein [Pyrinomonadaceae bacterium]
MFLKRKDALLFVIILFAFVRADFAQLQSFTQLVKRIKPAVVAIITYDKDGEKLSQGSGFFIASNRVITNLHVVEDAYKAEIKTHDGKTYQVNGVLGSDDEGDLAVLEINLPVTVKITPLIIAKIKPEEGERILVIGNPLGLEGTISDGLVSSIRVIPDFGSIIQITAPISPGSSGSPVINLQGQVIGVATSQLAKGQNLNFAMSSGRITKIKITAVKSIPDFVTETNQKKFAKAGEMTNQGRILLEQEAARAIKNKDKYNSEQAKKDAEKAIPLFLEALEVASNFAPAWFELGRAYYELEKFQDAIKVFEISLNLGYKEFILFDYLANSYRETKQFSLAISTLNKLSDFDKRFSSYAAERIGDIYYWDLENNKESYLNYLKAFRLPQLNIQDGLKGKLLFSILRYGLDLSLDEKYYDAIEVYSLLIELGNESSAYNFIGEQYYYLKQYSKAAEYYKKAINLKSDFYLAWKNLAAVYLFGYKNYNAAADAAKTAIRIKPDYDEGFYFLGMIYYFSGNDNLAFEQYKILKPLNAELANRLLDLLNGK